MLDYLYSKHLLMGVTNDTELSNLKKELEKGIIRKMLNGKRKTVRFHRTYMYETLKGKVYMTSVEREETRKSKIDIYVDNKLVIDISTLKQYIKC